MTDVTHLLARASEEQPPLSITRETSLAAGRRAARRRRAMRVLASTVAIAVATLTVGTAFRLSVGQRNDEVAASPNAAAVTYPVPQLPRAPDVPGAAARPDLVGSDPLLRHFTIDSSAWPVGEAVYTSGEGVETVSAGALTVAVGRDQSRVGDIFNVRATEQGPSASPIAGHTTRTPTTVDGRPATLVSTTFPDAKDPFWGLIWQPVAGLWVAVYTQTLTGEAELWSDVAAIHLDRAQHCVVPFTLTNLPAGAHLLSCAAGVPGHGESFAQSTVEVGDRHGNAATVTVGAYTRTARSAGNGPAPSLPAPNRYVAGHPVWWSSAPPRGFVSDDFGGVPMSVTVQGDYGEAQAVLIIAGLRLATDLGTPSAWPDRPVS